MIASGECIYFFPICPNSKFGDSARFTTGTLLICILRLPTITRMILACILSMNSPKKHNFPVLLLQGAQHIILPILFFNVRNISSDLHWRNTYREKSISDMLKMLFLNFNIGNSLSTSVVFGNDKLSLLTKYLNKFYCFVVQPFGNFSFWNYSRNILEIRHSRDLKFGKLDIYF